ncbi:beta-defensin 15-like [Dromiciops gliroides]|uniref:beta-defensin 15-like n=1 Tax=Dromiciops gliroides TaxID=33562 RepID=UPI001CC5B7FC|nr:beta-defensin 15-like [Dromiciops gliroides]
MGTFLFLFAVVFFLAQPNSVGTGFLEEKCLQYEGRCVAKCQINEELVALCGKFQKCCKLWEPCQ